MKSIWKFHIVPAKNQVIKMPREARILCVQKAFEEPFLFAMVDPDAPLENRFFKNISTDDEFIYSVNEIYLGTYQIDVLVIHVFEVIK